MNTKILIDQRNAAQLMYTNSESSVLALQHQLAAEQKVLANEVKALKQLSGGVTSDAHVLLSKLENVIQGLESSVSSVLLDWDAAKTKELLALSQLCEYIESNSADCGSNHERIQAISDKLDAFIHQNPVRIEKENGVVDLENVSSDNRNNHIAEALLQLSPPQSGHVQPDESTFKMDDFTSMLLYGSSGDSGEL